MLEHPPPCHFYPPVLITLQTPVSPETITINCIYVATFYRLHLSVYFYRAEVSIYLSASFILTYSLYLASFFRYLLIYLAFTFTALSFVLQFEPLAYSVIIDSTSRRNLIALPLQYHPCHH
jgi:hypothetical protein